MPAISKNKYSLIEGGIASKLFLVATPIIMTSLFQMAYNLTDMFWLGALSSYAVAASGTVGLFLWMSVAFMIFGRMGAEIGVSQSFGREDRPAALVFAQNAVFVAFCMGVGLAVVFYFGSGVFVGFFRIAEANVEAYAIQYLAMVSFSMPMMFVSAAVMGIFNGTGNSRVSLLIGGVGFSCNMLLTPVLIFVAGLGVRGAGLATVFAHSIALALALVLLKKYRNRPFEKIRLLARPNGFALRQIFRWVTPVSVESFFFTSLTMLASLLIVSFGAGAMAAARVSSQIESLTWLVGGGFASALTAFTGQNYGAQKWGRIAKGFRVSSILMACWGLFVAGVLFFGGSFLIGLFIRDCTEIVAIGAENLRILALVQIPQCLEGVAAGVFRGQGKTLPPSISSIVSNALRVVLAFALVRFTGLGLTGVWIAIAAGAGVRGVWVYVWYLWYSRRVPAVDS
ncbi:MAG: MATE family efflux transporter [Defluviitaleaceae bacterium]|nr:MATE family efflux transporter [Defluviitaleaceae bacterium]